MLRVSFKSWLGSWPEWGVCILLFLALEIVVGSIEQAQWITPQPSLTLVLVLAVLTGWLLCQSRLPAIVIHPLAVVLGAAVTVWQASNLLPSPEMTSRVGQLAVALQSWWQTISTAKPSEGTIHFAVFLIFFTWIMGYISTWFIRRKQNAWVAVSLGAITILINLSNLTEEHYTFFFFYTLAALLLVGQTSLAKHHYWFKKHDITYPNRGIIYFMTSLLFLSTVLVSAAWLTPEVRVERWETLISTKTLWIKNIEKHFNNLLAAVPAKQPFLKSGEQEKLLFGDSYGLGDELQFAVISDRPYYLRSRMYDIYTSSGWTSSQATETILSQGISRPQDDEIPQRSEITYTVVPKVRTNSLLTAGEFISSSMPIAVQSLAPANYNIDLLHPNNDSSLPEDVALLARSLRTVQDADGEISLDELWRLLPRDLRLTDFSASQYSLVEDRDTLELTPVSAQLTTVEVTRTQPASSDIVAVTSLRSLRPDRRYTVTTSISAAAPEALSGAGDDYPYWVSEFYLQLPSTLPERVRQLSESVTKKAESPYGKVLAIKRYLSQFKYSLEVKAPPQGADGVGHFLFTQKSGNCVQFASAMAVMLRSVGIPSRFLSGYSPGEWDATTESFILTSKERHTWTEVYFPGYGWVEFDATPEFEVTPGGGSGLEGWPWSEEMGVDEWLEWLRWLRGLEPQERAEWLELLGLEEWELDEWLEQLEQWEQVGRGIVEEDLVGGGVGATSRNRLGLTLFFTITLILLAYILWSALYSWRQRLVRSDYASETYRKMCFLASLLKLGPKPQQTPLEYYAGLTSVFPRQAEALDCIVQTYLERQFSRRKELDHWQKWKLKKSWREVYPILLKRLFHLRY